MNFRKDETLTGLFVLVTVAIVAGAVVALSAPGVFHRQNTYYVYFDNAGGLEPGAGVLLAGRRVGEVVSLQSPVPVAERPPDHQDMEARIEIRVARSERIYNSVTVRMQPYGLLGLELIDFVNGDETTGVAASGTKFVGERVAQLGDATEQLTSRLTELKTTIGNLNELTSSGSDLRATAANAREFTDTIKKQPWRLFWPSKKKSQNQASPRGTAPSDHKPGSP